MLLRWDDLLKRAYVGIDLAASPTRCSGYAVITCSDSCELHLARCYYSDDEIVNAICDLKHYELLIVSIDAPFNLSTGMRDVDRKMISLGFKVFPPSFKHMRLLTLRAMRLVERLKSLGITHVYETHPRSALLNSNCGDVGGLLSKLPMRLGSYELNNLDKDVRDALIASVVSYCIDSNCYFKVEGSDGVIWLLDNICK